MTEPGEHFWGPLWRTYTMAWAYPRRMALLLVMTAALGLISGFLVLVLRDLIDLFSTAQAGVVEGDADKLAANAVAMRHYALAIVVFAPLAAVSAFISWYVGQWLANRSMLDLKNRFLAHLIHLDLDFHSGLAKGDLITRMSADMQTMQVLVQLLFSRLLQRTVEILGVVVWLYVISWWLALVLTLVLLPALMLINTVFRKTRKSAQAARETLADTLVVLEQVSSGIRVIKAMGANTRERERFDDVNRRLFEQNLKVARHRGQADALSHGMAFVLAAAALLLGSWLFASGGLTPATMVAFLAAIGRIAVLARTTQRSWGEVLEHMPAAERIFAILDRPSRITDPADAGDCPPPTRSLTLEEVGFRYAPDAQWVLSQCSLEIPVGSTVALVGESGVGKSTILDLLPRFHDVEQGRIAIDGRDLREFRHESLIAHFSIVQQDSFLFNDTVYRNIHYGRPGASRTEVEDAARRAHVHEAILALEGGQGYETMVGDRGERLSGGQRQRVAIARALLRDAPVLLLDEPTSALDAESEAHVQQALAELMKGRTCVIVAHRLATVQNADRIYVLGKRERRVVEAGSHEELLAAGGEYARLVGLQRLREGGHH